SDRRAAGRKGPLPGDLGSSTRRASRVGNSKYKSRTHLARAASTLERDVLKDIEGSGDRAGGAEGVRDEDAELPRAKRKCPGQREPAQAHARRQRALRRLGVGPTAAALRSDPAANRDAALLDNAGS